MDIFIFISMYMIAMCIRELGQSLTGFTSPVCIKSGSRNKDVVLDFYTSGFT